MRATNLIQALLIDEAFGRGCYTPADAEVDRLAADVEAAQAVCNDCNGSGEGMHDGTKCRTCKGSGTQPVSRDEEQDADRWDGLS